VYLCNQAEMIFQDDNNTPTNQQTNKPRNRTIVGSKQDLPLYLLLLLWESGL
jgi:hypothetical protein